MWSVHTKTLIVQYIIKYFCFDELLRHKIAHLKLPSIYYYKQKVAIKAMQTCLIYKKKNTKVKFFYFIFDLKQARQEPFKLMNLLNHIIQFLWKFSFYLGNVYGKY